MFLIQKQNAANSKSLQIYKTGQPYDQEAGMSLQIYNNTDSVLVCPI